MHKATNFASPIPHTFAAVAIPKTNLSATVCTNKLDLKRFKSGNGFGNVQTHGRAYVRSVESVESGVSQELKLHRPPKSISSFMDDFKSASTSKIDDYIDAHNLSIKKFMKKNRLWQINYHDHIIQSDAEYRRINNYIRNNPKKLG
ncbi:MAG: hypothetical protein EOM83_09820 [Clostridia bacterium]|nr:hypothetical protein [Clostridia bacterium]